MKIRGEWLLSSEPKIIALTIWIVEIGLLLYLEFWIHRIRFSKLAIPPLSIKRLHEHSYTFFFLQGVGIQQTHIVIFDITELELQLFNILIELLHQRLVFKLSLCYLLLKRLFLLFQRHVLLIVKFIRMLKLADLLLRWW